MPGRITYEKNKLCACLSGEKYSLCCEKFHKRKAYPENALALMRSRYSAYALNLPDYIITTTHHLNPCYSANKEQWRKEIIHFSQQTDFIDLKILEFINGKETATVTFTVELQQKEKRVVYTEKSHFILTEGKWLYK